MANEKNHSMNADLLRQRRNLLITSLILTAVILAGATLKKDISVLGTSLEISNPERAVWGIWILWGYFLLRYWQYLNEVSNLGILDAMERWILRKIGHSEYEDYVYWVSWRYIFLFDLYAYDRELNQEHSSLVEKIGPQGLLMKLLWSVLAFLSVAFSTPRFTDYLLPLLVALVPVSLAIISNFGASM